MNYQAIPTSTLLCALLAGAPWCALAHAADPEPDATVASAPASAATVAAAAAAQPGAQAQADADAKPSGKIEKGSMPMTKTVVSREAMESQSATDGSEAIKNVAGVTSSNAKSAENSSVNVRGIQVNLMTSYRLNGGLPITGVITTPSENKERIETLKGANALMFGIASPGGIVNVVTKRAQDVDVNNLAYSLNSFGGYGLGVDVGRKFGDEKQYGLRVNVAGTHVSNGVHDATGTGAFGSVAGDWQASRALSFKLDVERYRRNVIEQAGIVPLKAVNGVIPVPRIPDPQKLLSGTWAHYTPETRNLQLRGDYLLDDDWSVMAEVGRSDSSRSRFNNRIANYDLATGQGTETTTFVRGQRYFNRFARTELAGHFTLWDMTHETTLGLSSNERFYNNPSSVNVKRPQNIYNPVVLAVPVAPAGAVTELPQDSKDTAVYLYDSVAVVKGWKLLAGLRRTHYVADDANPNGSHSVTTRDITSPAAGLLYDLAPRTTVYVSFMKGLEETGQAPIGTANESVILPPAIAKQTEIGIRSGYFSGVSANVAYFDIKRANAVTNSVTNVFELDGTTGFTGVEATVSAELAKSLTLNMAGQWLDAVQHPLSDKSLEGRRPENTPKVSGNMSLAYKVTAVPGLSLRVGSTFFGPRFIDGQNLGSIPGVALFSLGAGYATRFSGKRASIQMSVDNLTNKAYWNSATTSAFGAGMVRAVKVTGKVDF